MWYDIVCCGMIRYGKERYACYAALLCYAMLCYAMLCYGIV